MMASRLYPARRGFTLVELLLSAVVSAVILTEVATMFYFASRQYRVSSLDQARGQEVSEAIGMMAADLSSPSSGSDSDCPLLIGNSGDDTGLTVTRRWLRVLRAADMREGSSPLVVDYFLYDDEGETLLVRRSEALDNIPSVSTITTASTDVASYEVLARSVSKFSVKFYDSNGLARQDWPRSLAPELPVLIELHLVTAPDADNPAKKYESFASVRIFQREPAGLTPLMEVQP